MTSIEWTDKTWNPIAGCTVVSEGCKNCYAINQAMRNAAMGCDKYVGTTRKSGTKHVWTGKINFDEKALLAPLKRKIPTRYFVNSMSDLFHENVPDEWIDKIFAVMALCPQHTFQVLTKRPERMREYYQNPARDDLITWAQAEFANRFQSQTVSLPNVWLGVSIEDQKTADERIPILLDTPAAVRWVSAEPLLGPVRLDRIGGWSETYEDLGRHPDDYWPANAYDAMWLDALFGVYAGEARLPDGQALGTIDVGLRHCGGKIDWVVVGGESGHGARPMHLEWVQKIQEQCGGHVNVPFLFKQWGTWLPHSHFVDQCVPDDDEITRYKTMEWRGDVWADVGKPVWSDFTDGVVDEDHCYALVGKKKAGRLLNGKTYDQYPEVQQ
ncbi:DUF5131 family protein [Terasakiella sp.]|uniref:DUF5131 family protein n=1 Tax=Terasakiella sp. TaxID=2034861 RepID=UPI003AA9AD5C